MQTLRAIATLLILAIAAFGPAHPASAQVSGTGETLAPYDAAMKNHLFPAFVGPALGCESVLVICVPAEENARLRVDLTAAVPPADQETSPEDRGRQDARRAVDWERWAGGAAGAIGLAAFLAAGRESALSQTIEKGLTNVETGTDYKGALVAGGVGTVIGWGIGKLVRASQFPNLEAGADPAYATAYRNAYRAEQRRIQSTSALIGGAFGTAVALLVSWSIDSAF